MKLNSKKSFISFSKLPIAGKCNCFESFKYIVIYCYFSSFFSSDYPIEPFLHFDNLAKDQSILWLGISGKSLGELKPADSIDIKLTAYPIRTGLCAIPCLRLSDPHLQVNYSFEEVAYVFVNATPTNGSLNDARED